MKLRSPRGLGARNGIYGLLAVAALTAVMSPVLGAAPTPGSSGTDTSLPLTDSAVTVHGRGRYADLEITVNQTRDLVNQAISITWSGAQPTQTRPVRFASDYLQVMQCWGDDDGTVADNPGPPPEQCVFGATDAVYGGRSTTLFPGGGFATERIISRRDFANYDPTVGYLDDRTGWVWRPFRAVDGTVVNAHYNPDFNPTLEGGSYWENGFFNVITTNEVPGARTSANGTGSDLFEVTTGLESSGLGCGRSVQPLPGGSTKVPKCWLVIVPRSDPGYENDGVPSNPAVATSPLAPRAWQHRIAIPLEFNPLDAACEFSAQERRINGSELAIGAISNWQPKLCGRADLAPFVFARVSDGAARQQLVRRSAGAAGMVVVSRPVAPDLVDPSNPVIYAPLTLSGTVIGFNVERDPKIDADAREQALAGVRVADLNLTPRLVAKLMTQSYQQQTAIVGSAPSYDWVKSNPLHMGRDPDFLQFNPEFEMLSMRSGKNFGGFVLPLGNSDAARQVWEWILADPEAKAWLDGTPDPWGMRVNPVYATRANANTTGFPFGDPMPESFPKSDPYCYQAAPLTSAGGAIITPPALCGTDWLPYTPTMRDAARLTRLADDTAKTIKEPTPISADKVWRADGPQLLGARTMLSITDSASAYQYGIQAARLSRAGDNRANRSFVGPDDDSLVAGVASMAISDDQLMLVPDPRENLEGAYPLTVLTWGAMTPLALNDDERREYADFIDYAVGDGQVKGHKIGQLPDGYTPLPEPLPTLGHAIADLVRSLKIAEVPVTGDGAGDESGSSDDSAVDLSALGGNSPAMPSATSATTAGKKDDSLRRGSLDGQPSGLMTPILALGRNRFVLPGLAVIALLAGLGTIEITKRPRRATPEVVAALKQGAKK